ncbi:dethiobiotin synthase [Flagellimonas baculiformis]|uniref:dethiobiotin synthase n=1 Tax=Flagellimonas baculiformis TaxID=3067310 RepID=UPI00296E57EC|nr:dethiobiotin synthase [Muricauda sp. D6]
MKLFITGISTEVGKTVASAIVVEALQADYWKPIQAGDLDNSDSHKVESLISNDKTVIHPNSYALNTPMSPHAAAEIDGVTIDLDAIVPPVTENHLVIEGAGGLLVPLNDTDTIFDLIQPDHKVIVVSRHYLGSINHTLLTIEKLQQKEVQVGIIFSGDEHPTTEEIILKKTGAVFLGRIHEEPKFDKMKVRAYADKFRAALLSF